MPDPTQSVREELGRMIHEQYYAVLATDQEGQPQTNLVAFICSDDLKYIVFITPRGSQKYRNIINNPLISLFIDNRTNGSADIFRATGVSVHGKCRILDEDDRQVWRDRYVLKHPDLSQFIADPENVMIGVDVHRYIVVNRFQSVVVLSLET